MATGTADRRYAKALFSLADEQGELESIHQDLTGLADLIDGSADFASFLSHPLIPGGQRKEALDAALEGKAHALTLRFLNFLDDQGRLGHLRGICEAFEELYFRHAGIVDARIISAAPMTEAQVEEIKNKLAKKLGQTIRASTETDEGLIGGFRVQIEDRILDLSLSSKLNTFKRQIINA